MTDANPELPPVGSDLIMEVVQSATRSTIFAEQAVVAHLPGAVELVFLRNELSIQNQVTKVKSHNEGSVELELKGANMLAQLCDVGHVRMNAPQALDLAVNLLDALRNSKLVGMDLITQKLTLIGLGPK